MLISHSLRPVNLRREVMVVSLASAEPYPRSRAHLGQLSSQGMSRTGKVWE